MAEGSAGTVHGEQAGSKLWGGRFREGVDPVMERFNRSLDYDRIMWQADITGSVAYARGLASIGLLQQDELAQICEGLERVKTEWQAGAFEVKVTGTCDKDAVMVT